MEWEGFTLSPKTATEILYSHIDIWASLVAQKLKRLPPMRETRVRSLGREDPLEKEMGIHSSILAWRIPWTQKPSRLQSTGSQRIEQDWVTSPSPSPSYIDIYNLYNHQDNQENHQDTHDDVITHLEPDILECEVNWALESITTNKASGGDGIPVELFQILKDDAVKVLHSICQQIWKTQQWPQDWKSSVSIPIPKKGNAKECSNYHTIALIWHASKVMLKILQARL